MFRIGPKGQTDPALVAFFAQRGMVHVTGNVQLPGMWSLLGGISLNLFASPDGRFYATQMPFAGPSKQMLVSSMLVFVLPGLNLPSVSVAPRGGDLPIAAQGEVVQFESTDFDNRFEVRTEDRRAAVMLIDQGVMQFLLDCGRVGFHAQGDHGTALLASAPGSNGVPEFDLLFRFYDGLMTRLPEILGSEFPAGAQTS